MLSCICKVHLMIVFFLTLLVYFLISNLIFVEIYYYEQEVRTYALKPEYVNFYRIMFYFIPLVMFAFTFMLMDVMGKLIFYEHRINDLRKSNRFLINENIFLKKKREIPTHIKKICVNHFINKKYNCSICLENITNKCNNYLTFCGHLFHKSCIDESLNFNSKCPYCRTIIDYDDLD